MYKKRKVKKRILRKINRINLSVMVISVALSFFVVLSCGSIQEFHTHTSSRNELLDSAKRLADAFDFYNTKRFVQE